MAQGPPDKVLSHWSTLVEGFNTSPLAFYDAVEAALKRREIPQTWNSRVIHKEAGFFSAEREYLHIRREKLTFDICGAPFGTGFFFSWWFSDDQSALHPFFKAMVLLVMVGFSAWLIWKIGLILGSLLLFFLVFGGLALIATAADESNLDDGFVRVLPGIGSLYVGLFRPDTFHRLDSMDMYQQAVHNAVLEVIDQMTTEKGLRALSEDARKPVMHRFYERKP